MDWFLGSSSPKSGGSETVAGILSGKGCFFFVIWWYVASRSCLCQRQLGSLSSFPVQTRNGCNHIYLLKPSVDNFDNGLANVTHTGLEDQMDFIKNIITFFSKKISKYFP